MHNPYARAVPKAYHRVSGLDRFSPNLIELRRGPVHYLCRDGISPRRIGESVFVQWRRPEKIVPVLVPRKESPVLFEAIAHLGEAVLTGVRLHRFTSAFKAYECLVNTPDIELAAIRHAISHPEAVLSRAKTVETLRLLFNGTRIDLQNGTHRRIYYRELGNLFVKVDAAVGDALTSGKHPWFESPRGFSPHHEAYVRMVFPGAV